MKKTVTKKDRRETVLKNFVALVNHPVTIAPTLNKEEVYEGKVPVVDIPVYKDCPRKEYLDSYENDFIIRKSFIGLSNLPAKIRGLKYIVSRKTLEAITQENKKIFEIERLEQIQSLLEKNTEAWLELQKDITELRRTLKFKEPRYDFFAPGTAIKDSTGKVIFCLGLISEID